MSEKEFFEDVRKSIGICLEKGMSYQAIANAVKVYVSTVYRWYNETAMPSAYAYAMLKELCARKDAN